MAKMKTKSARREAMGGLAKGLSVIRAFTRESAALSLSEIAALTHMPAATVRRCLLTLEELGYLVRNGRQFVLRPKVLELGGAYLESMNIEHLTKTHLEELASKTGDSAALCVLDGTDIIYVARASVRTLMRLEAHVGSRFPAYATSMGRVLLAALSPEELDRYLAEATLEPLTARTVTDQGQLRAIIGEVAAQGYAIVDQELEEGLRAVAAPIRGSSDVGTAAINISAHASRVSIAALRGEILPALLETAAQIEADLQAQGTA
jgi:IclR family transcriptional regulator, pca regulon regulatory protein